MLKLKFAVVAAATILLGLFAASGAQAADYQEPSIEVALSNSTTTQVEGGNFTINVSSGSDTVCDWTVTFNGTARTGTGSSFSASFTAPQVDKKTQFPVTITCSYDDGQIGPTSTTVETDPSAVTNALYVPNSNTALQAATQTTTRTVMITVLPAGSDATDGNTDNNGGAGALPNTGGTNANYIWGGAALIVLGGVAVFAVRRRGIQS